MGIRLIRRPRRTTATAGRWSTIVHRAPDRGATFVASELGTSTLPDGTVITGTREWRRAKLTEAKRAMRRERRAHIAATADTWESRKLRRGMARAAARADRATARELAAGGLTLPPPGPGPWTLRKLRSRGIEATS